MVACGRRRRMIIVVIVTVIALVKICQWRDPQGLNRQLFIVTPRRGPLKQTQFSFTKELQTQPGVEAPPERLWHLDLKGAPSRISVIEGVMMLAAKAGATGVLVEWEDMFPYSGTLANLSAYNAYTLEEVNQIAKTAKAARLNVVHLMQSLGHLEYALKLPQWAELREGESPGEACPTHPGTARLVMAAIDQLMTAIPTSVIHIGADEVFTLGKCNLCRARGVPPLQLYVDHVVTVARHVKSRWGATVMIWDDMLRHAPPALLHSLGGLVEPTVWAYGPDVTRMVPPYILRTYAAVFPRVWLAPAFKGASGPRAIMPDAAKHTANTLAWVQVGNRMQRYSDLKVAGIVVTGWSRYDHFAVLCELLPPSIPSLVLTLLTASRGYLTPATIRDTHTLLECSPHVILDLTRDPLLWAARECGFPGSNVVSFLHRYVSLKDMVNAMQKEAQETGGWLTFYNIHHNFSSPSRIREATNSIGHLRYSLNNLTKEVRAVLAQYHDNATVTEWLEQHLDPLNQTLSTLHHTAKSLLSFKTWPRRPLDRLHPPPPLA